MDYSSRVTSRSKMPLAILLITEPNTKFAANDKTTAAMKASSIVHRLLPR